MRFDYIPKNLKKDISLKLKIELREYMNVLKQLLNCNVIKTWNILTSKVKSRKGISEILPNQSFDENCEIQNKLVNSIKNDETGKKLLYILDVIKMSLDENCYIRIGGVLVRELFEKCKEYLTEALKNCKNKFC